MNDKENVKVIDNDAKIVGVEKMCQKRTVSIFIVNHKNEWLIQKRSDAKCLGAGLWTNSCSTHPYPNEDSIIAAQRRIAQELGMNVYLNELFQCIYDIKNSASSKMSIEHIYFGQSGQIPHININEIAEYEYVSFEELVKWVNNKPEQFTDSFKSSFLQVYKHIA